MPEQVAKNIPFGHLFLAPIPATSHAPTLAPIFGNDNMLAEQTNNLKMIIYLDFDGTVVEHQYPLIGPVNAGWTEVVDKLYKAGHEIIINTMRTEYDKKLLGDAMEFINQSLTKENNQTISNALKYTDHKFDPSKWDWDLHFNTRRIFIDDVCEGIPLKKGLSFNRDIVDWDTLNIEFKKHGLYR